LATELTAELLGASGASGASGEAEFSTETEDGQTEVEFEVEIEDAAANTTYDVFADDVLIGQVTTDDEGEGEFETEDPALLTSLAEGSLISVQDSTGVVLLEGTLVLGDDD
jgi:hypothetical protein